MTNISAHDLFRQVKNEIGTLDNTGEMRMPFGEYINQVFSARFRDEDNVTVEYGGKEIAIPCSIKADDDTKARAIMCGFAKLYLGKTSTNESADGSWRSGGQRAASDNGYRLRWGEKNVEPILTAADNAMKNFDGTHIDELTGAYNTLMSLYNCHAFKMDVRLQGYKQDIKSKMEEIVAFLRNYWKA